MRRVDRRTFLKRLGVASAAAAAAGAVPGMVFPTDAILRPGGQSGPVWKKTPCRLCGVGCGLLVAIENGRAVAVKGDPDSPVSKGLACVKGYNSVQALYGRDRLAHAMVRRDGALVEVPLNETLDLVARRLRETVEQHGKNSVAIYGSAQWTITGCLHRVEAVQGSAGNQQRGDQRAPLRRQRDGWPPEQLRPRRWDRLLRGHRPRRRLRVVGRQSGRNRPGSLLSHAGPQAGESRRPDHRGRDPHHAHQLRRRPLPASRAACRGRRSPTASATKSWPGNGCSRSSSPSTSPSNGGGRT